jgi:hypothetical protein
MADTDSTSPAEDPAGGGRRSGDRRRAAEPFTGPDRRKTERRSGTDRRAEPRSNGET